MILAFGVPDEDVSVILRECTRLIYDNPERVEVAPFTETREGGNKRIQSIVATAAFNYMGSVTEYAERLRALPWDAWGCSYCQVMAMGEDNDGFAIVEVYRHQYADPPGFHR
jgi:hypothetical protein